MITLWQHHLSIALQAAELAGQIQRQSYARRDLQTEAKSNPKDLVTEVDKACDAAIQQLLLKHFPHDVLITEETFVEGQSLDMSHTWVVDPLDGTTNYAHSFPHFAVSIAYVQEGRPVVGVVWDEMKQECFVAVQGEGATLNGRRMSVSLVTELSVALLSTGFPPNQTELDNFQHFIRLTKASHGVRRAGAAALDLAYVACGRLDGFWEPKLSPWDVAAGMLIVQEAGGFVSNYRHEPIDLTQRHIHIVAANHASLMEPIMQICHPS